MTPITALITGASSTIGTSIARKLASGLIFPPKYWAVADSASQPDGRHQQASPIRPRPVLCTLVSRSPKTAQETLSSLAPVGPGLEHRYVNGDVTDPDFWDTLGQGRLHAFDAAGKDLGPAFTGKSSRSSGEGGEGVDPVTAAAAAPLAHLDFLINVAGLSHSSLLYKTKASVINQVVATNLLSVMYAVSAMTGLLLKSPGRRSGATAVVGDGEPRPSPCVVAISSLLATRYGRGSAAYAASKAGVDGLVRALATEMSPLKVRVSGVAPGWVADSGMRREFIPDDKLETETKKIPLGRMAEAEEIADAVAFVLTSEYFTGETVKLHGGLGSA